LKTFAAFPRETKTSCFWFILCIQNRKGKTKKRKIVSLLCCNKQSQNKTKNETRGTTTNEDLVSARLWPKRPRLCQLYFQVEVASEFFFSLFFVHFH
jgi:hypothetical protein